LLLIIIISAIIQYYNSEISISYYEIEFEEL